RRDGAACRAARGGAAARARTGGTRERAARAVRGRRALVRPAGPAHARRGLMEVAVLGLGEAGGRIAADLVDAGVTVRGWDPAHDWDGVTNATDAVSGADVVLSVNAAAVALEA